MMFYPGQVGQMRVPKWAKTACQTHRLVHHAIILEMTGSSFRTEQAKGRQTPITLTESDPSMARDTPSNHRALETVTEPGGHSADVKM